MGCRPFKYINPILFLIPDKMRMWQQVMGTGILFKGSRNDLMVNARRAFKKQILNFHFKKIYDAF